MKNILFVVTLLIAGVLRGQSPALTLRRCIDAALANKANIQAAKTETVIAGLQSSQAKGRYLPQISLAYDYRYNPIIATQIIPSGQFLPVPTDELRPIQFGTDWQQNAGMTVYQPMMDFTLKSKIAERRINERIRDADLSKAEDELKYEVLNSFGRLHILEQERMSAVNDTARTFRSLALVEAKFEEGRVLKTEHNKALLNHNNNKGRLLASRAEIAKEKIYLSFLTGIDLGTLLDADLDYAPLMEPELLRGVEGIVPDSIADFRKLEFQQRLLLQQIQTEKRKIIPTLGVEGFIGANQYSRTFDPFLANSWFGSSYIGLSLKMQLLSGEDVSKRVKELEAETQVLAYNKAELESELKKDYLQANEDIAVYKAQIAILEQNVSLMEENVRIYQERLNSGQIQSSELNLQEIDLQAERNQLLQRRASLISKQIDRLKASGNLGNFVRQLE